MLELNFLPMSSLIFERRGYTSSATGAAICNHLIASEFMLTDGKWGYHCYWKLKAQSPWPPHWSAAGNEHEMSCLGYFVRCWPRTECRLLEFTCHQHPIELQTHHNMMTTCYGLHHSKMVGWASIIVTVGTMISVWWRAALVVLPHLKQMMEVILFHLW